MRRIGEYSIAAGSGRSEAVWQDGTDEQLCQRLLQVHCSSDVWACFSSKRNQAAGAAGGRMGRQGHQAERTSDNTINQDHVKWAYLS
jgi:hypothetical protein